MHPAGQQGVCWRPFATCTSNREQGAFLGNICIALIGAPGFRALSNLRCVTPMHAPLATCAALGAVKGKVANPTNNSVSSNSDYLVSHQTFRYT